jgi:hypothetical protein
MKLYLTPACLPAGRYPLLKEREMEKIIAKIEKEIDFKDNPEGMKLI